MLRPIIVVILAASIAGLFLSADLTYVHYKTFTDSDYHSICEISDAWNCQTVAISEYSVFFRLPVSLWGLLVYMLYLFFTVIAWVDLRRERKGGVRGLGVIFCMAVIGLGLSGLLYYISAAVIRSKCIMCVGLYVINTIMFVAMVVYAAKKKESPLGWIGVDVRGLLVPPRKALAGPVVVAAAAVLLLVLYPRLYINDVNCGAASSPADRGEQTCDEDATYGPTDAPVVITEFSDYQCPYCAMTHFTLRKAVNAFDGKVMLKHRHFPLDNACNPLVSRPFHRNACLAAKAAVCAGMQNRFWDYNDILWKNQKNLDRDGILGFAGKIGLDVKKFERCLDKKETLAHVLQDIEEATNTQFVQSGMVGTPIIYIGDHPHIGAITYTELEKVIRAQLSKH
jgi:protein-disulfide isomerase/uncharacterized membrane protein